MKRSTTDDLKTSTWSLPFRGSWVVLRYLPTALWSLKSSRATSSGGKSLLVPTPYSVKLGLIDAIIQTSSIQEGEELFHLLKGRPLRICPPISAVVSATFLKMWKIDVCPDKAKGESEDEYNNTVRQSLVECNPLADRIAMLDVPITVLKRYLRETFSPTVGFREYIQFGGNDEEALLQIAIAADGINLRERSILARAAVACSYSGKRGSFLRYVPAETADGLLDLTELPEEAPYTLPCSIWRSASRSVRLGTIQPLDDLGMAANWDHVNTYGLGRVYAAKEGMMVSGRNKRVSPDRVFVESFIPYRLSGTSRGYSYYRRTDVA